MTWQLVSGIVFLFGLVCMLLSSIRIFLYRFFDTEWSIDTKPVWWVFLWRKVFSDDLEPSFLRFITAYGWCSLVPFIVAAAIGGFGRGDISPLPWEAFSWGNDRDGILYGMLAVVFVVIADVWLFFGVSQWALWCEKNNPDRNPEVLAIKQKCYLLINIVVGLLLVSKGNAVHRLLNAIF